MNFQTFFRRHRPRDHKAKLGITEAVEKIDEAAAEMPADPAAVEQPKPAQKKAFDVIEHFGQNCEQSLTWLQDRRLNLVKNREATTANYERYMAETDEDLRQVDLAIAAHMEAQRILNGEPSEAEVANANEKARAIVRQAPSKRRRKPAEKTPPAKSDVEAAA